MTLVASGCTVFDVFNEPTTTVVTNRRTKDCSRVINDVVHCLLCLYPDQLHSSKLCTIFHTTFQRHLSPFENPCTLSTHSTKEHVCVKTCKWLVKMEIQEDVAYLSESRKTLLIYDLKKYESTSKTKNESPLNCSSLFGIRYLLLFWAKKFSGTWGHSIFYLRSCKQYISISKNKIVSLFGTIGQSKGTYSLLPQAHRNCRYLISV